MDEKLYNVTFSYTLDYISWTCPKCGAFVSKQGDNLYDLECDECGYTRDECSLDSQDTTDDSEMLTYLEDEEE